MEIRSKNIADVRLVLSSLNRDMMSIVHGINIEMVLPGAESRMKPFSFFEIDFWRLLWLLVSSNASTSSLSISNYSRAACPRTASSSITKQCGVVHFPTSISGAENWKIMSLSPLTSGAFACVVCWRTGGGGGFNRREKRASRVAETTLVPLSHKKYDVIIDTIRSRNRGFGSPRNYTVALCGISRDAICDLAIKISAPFRVHPTTTAAWLYCVYRKCCLLSSVI